MRSRRAHAPAAAKPRQRAVSAPLSKRPIALDPQLPLLPPTPDQANAEASLRRLLWFAPGGKLLHVGDKREAVLSAAQRFFDVDSLPAARWGAKKGKGLDAVAFIDSLERQENPAEALKKAAAMLRLGGALYLVAPDTGGWSAKFFGLRWRNLPEERLRLFSRANLRETLARLGLQIASEESFARVLTVDQWFERMRDIPVPFFHLFHRAARAFGWAEKPLALNLFDSVEFIAVKTPKP